MVNRPPPAPGIGCVAVSIDDVAVRRHVERSLAALGVRYRVTPAGGPGKRDHCHIACIECSALPKWIARREAIVLVRCGKTVTLTDAELAWLTRKSVVIVESGRPTHVELLHALILASSGASLAGLRTHLTKSSLLRQVPEEVIAAFLAGLARLYRLQDLARELRMSSYRCRQLIGRAGFRRAEHLLTALRAEAWIWCARQGLTRKWFESYLGIPHRSNFARACDRARIERPWHRVPPRLSCTRGVRGAINRLVRSPAVLHLSVAAFRGAPWGDLRALNVE